MSDISIDNNITLSGTAEDSDTILEGSIDYVSVVTSTTFGLIEGEVEDNTKLVAKFATKQDVIDDLEEIRSNASKGLQASKDLIQETTERQQVDKQLQESILDVDNRIATEESTRLKADEQLQSSIDLKANQVDLDKLSTQVVNNTTSITTETTERQQADSKLQKAINDLNITSYLTKTEASSTYATKSSLATVATSGSYTDLSNKPTIPTVNNATITLKQGDTVKGTFTTNQSSSATINLDSGSDIDIDSKISSTSTNPVQNKVIYTELTKKQNTLVSGTSIKTVNGQTLLGSGNIKIETGTDGQLPTGGTAGQYLVKNSSTNYDAKWSTLDTSSFLTKSNIVNNLTSTSATNALSANQGRVLKSLVDTKTSNVGTITGIKMNGSSKGTSGVVDLGTVITAHQDISGKANTADLAKVATSGSYDDLANKPTLATVATSGSYADLTNTPTIPDVSVYIKKTVADETYATKTVVSNEVTRATTAESTLSTNLSTETSERKAKDEEIETNLSSEIARAGSAESILTNNISKEATARATKDSDLQHQIDALNSRSDVVDVVATKADLDSYDKDLSENDIIKVLQDESQEDDTSYYRNTASTKPYVWELVGVLGQYYTKSETDSKINTVDNNISIHTSNVSNPHKVTKAQVDLGNVDNTSDLNKPISTATQSALDKKLDSSSYVIDTALSSTSTNPVQNKVINNAITTINNNLGTKANSSDLTTESTTRSNADTTLQNNIDIVNAKFSNYYTKDEIDELLKNVLIVNT